MVAPEGNKNAKKPEKGVQINFYIGSDEVAAIKKILQHLDVEISEKSIRKFAREQSKNGLWLAIRDELPPIIV